MSLLNLIQKRRSIYNLKKGVPLTQTEITELVTQTLKYCPSAFNSQSARVVLLYNEQNQKLWDIVKQKLQTIVPKENFAKTAEKINSFAAGFATILYFEDEETISGLQQKYPLYQENFPIWSLQSAGMLQFAVWTALAEKNIGASLQHYNPLIDDEVRQSWNLPQSWKLLAQMPIGGIGAPAESKTFLPIEERIKVFS